jgi:hypothetical protein
MRAHLSVNHETSVRGPLCVGLQSILCNSFGRNIFGRNIFARNIFSRNIFGRIFLP